MMELFDTKTRKPDPIDDADTLHQALLAGTHSFAAGTQVSVTNPDGELGTVPAENIRQAIGQGYKVETPSQRAVREYVDQNQGLKGAVKVGVGQMADEALMGIPELILDHTQDPLEVAKREALKKEHDFANTVGGLTGFGASMLVGGPLFKGAAKAGEAVTAQVADRILAAGGEEVGKRTAKTVAKEILARAASKGAGGAVEGGIIAAPHAITEAALGDPENAAETLVSGVGIGALFGGGGALAKDFFKLGAAGLKRGEAAITDAAEASKPLAAKVAASLTGVTADDVMHYAANIERVNAAPLREDIADRMALEHSKGADLVDIAKEKANAAQRELDQSYQASKFDLSRTRPPEAVADDLLGALEHEKVRLGEMSTAADELLATSGKEFKTSSIVDFLDKEAGKLKIGGANPISDEATRAYSKIMDLKGRVLSGFEDTIQAPDLRALLQDARRDINYNQAAGEFNNTLNGALKGFTGGVSDMLKREVPGYAEAMAPMAARAGMLEQMSRAFGTKDRAVGALNSLLTPRGAIKDKLLSEFSALTGQDFMAPLEQFRTARTLLEESKRGDIREKLLPELTAKAQQAKADLEKALAEFEPIKRLTPERLQNIIRTQGFKTASTLDRRAIEAMGERAGVDFSTQIKDRNVLESFSKASTNGSRKTNLGAILGAAVGGGPAGAAIGASTGALADNYAGTWLKKLIDANKDKSGLLFAEKAMKRTAEKLDQIPGLLSRMGEKTHLPPVKSAAIAGGLSIITHMLDGDKAPAKADTSVPQRIKRLEDFSEKSAVWASNPAAAADKIAAMTSKISGAGAPQIGAAMGGKMATALNYLHASMPKAPRPQSPFAPKVTYKPSDYDLSVFEQKAQVVADPFSVLSELEHGTLTRNHMEALKAVYPGIHSMMIRKVHDAAIKAPVPLPYAKRVKLSLLMDASFDPSLSAAGITYYQQTYAQPDLTQTPDGGSPAPDGFKAKVDLVGMQSESDRISNRNA